MSLSRILFLLISFLIMPSLATAKNDNVCSKEYLTNLDSNITVISFYNKASLDGVIDNLKQCKKHYESLSYKERLKVKDSIIKKIAEFNSVIQVKNQEKILNLNNEGEKAGVTVDNLTSSKKELQSFLNTIDSALNLTCKDGFFANIESNINLFQLDVNSYADTLKAEFNNCRQILASMPKSDRDDIKEKLTKKVDHITAYINTKFTKLYEAKIANDTKSVDSLKTEINNLTTSKKILEEYLLITRQKQKLDQGWNDTFLSNFYIGYEGTTVSSLKAQGTARIGMMFYNQVNGKLGKDNRWGIHLFSNTLLTSSAENSNADNNTKIKQAIEFDVNAYIPFLIGGIDENTTLALGPIFTSSIRKIDESSNFLGKNMVGARLAHSPESYFDFLYGKVEGLSEKRIEVRGQYPVGNLINGRIFIGGGINISASSIEQDNDTLKLYVTWNVNFSDIFAVK